MERQKVLEEIESNRSDRMSKRKQQRQRQTEQFLKSMQMLQANAKPDHSQPFEDYSIFLYRQTAPKFKDRVKDLEKQFTYIPDYENRQTGLKPLANTNAEDDIASKIKSLEDRWTTQQPVDKKPKDLMRAIGKIETSDWNIKEIEKKILENKIGKPSSQNKDKERVPRWSKEEFRARQTKMEKKHLEPQDSIEEKYAEIDKNIKHLEMKLKEGTSRDLGQNKVASITEKLVSKVPQKEVKEHVEKAVSKAPLNLPVQSASENCHFCGKRVYLMEKLSAEGRFFHNGCFKCQYCHTQLRLGSYTFDRDGHYGHKFFCVHHYGMQGELPQPVKLARKQSQRTQDGGRRSLDNKNLSGVQGVDLLDRVQTPERIEFANLSTGHLSSDHEDPLSQMDEDEWTDKNFGASCAELDDSDEESSSSLSDTDSDDEDAYDDAMEEPVTKEGTMKWAERWKNSYRKRRGSDSDDYSSSDHSSYYENSTDDSDSETATEGEEEIRARELRQQEVRVQPPKLPSDTGTDTEIVSDESSSESSSEIQNSATEISTDSEFAQDEPTPTREIPSILLNDFNVTKTRGTGSRNYPRKIHVTTGFIGKAAKGQKKPDIELKLTPLVPTTLALKKTAPAPLPRIEGYALNRTQSTGGIAAKVSLELKKRYLLGESGAGSIQKSGSASTLDTKFKSFQNTISDCQKLLKPAPEISASMQVFCSKLDERHSPILSPKTNSPFFKDEKKEEKDEHPLPAPDITITAIEESKNNKNQCNDDNRPRSPIHEASITVPDINWQHHDKNQSSDSLSVNSSSENEPGQSRNFQFENIPRVEVHTANDNEKDDLLLDSLCPDINNKIKEEVSLDNKDDLNKHTSQSLELNSKSQEHKSVSSEKKSLNQPKSLPNLENTFPEIHKALHVKLKEKDSPDENKSSKTISGKSTPEGTTALTETELSDWARDGNVSDDMEFDFSQGSENIFDKPKAQENPKDFKNKIAPISNTLEANLDSIEFMDTGTETSSDDGIVDSQNGYVLFKDEEDLIEDSLNPNINEILEARNIYITRKEDDQKTPTVPINTGFCIADDKTNQFGSEVIDLKPADLEILKQKQTLTDHEEDSLLIVETGTTTEENTCSDSTVKNITEITKDSVKEKMVFKVENFQKQRLEDKLAKVKAEAKEQLLKDGSKNENLEFQEHCQRLQVKVDFGNAKDSIDIRKSRRKSKTDILNQPDLIQEEKEKSSPTKDITLNLSPVVSVPDAMYKKENIKKERDVNQKLIQEMVMNKMKAENKSLERKKRNRTGASNLSPSRPYELTKSSTTDSVTKINLNNLERSSRSPDKSIYVTPDLVSSSSPLQNSQSSNVNNSFEKFASSLLPKSNKPRPLSVFSTLTDFKKPETSLLSSENCSMPDIRKDLFATEDTTPKAPPRYNRPSDIIKTAERLKETARARARLLSNEDLGISPEDRINRLKDKFCRTKDTENVDPLVQESIESLVLNTERRNSLMYSNDTLTKKKNNSFKRSKSGENDIEARIPVHKSDYDTTPMRTKSIPELPKKFTTSNQVKGEKKICKSDSNLLEGDNVKPKKEKKSKDRERRKSITKLLTNIFTKKSPTGSKENKGIFSRLSPKSKPISKSCTDLDNIEPQEKTIDETDKRKSFSEVNIQKRDLTPPPVPPLPANYTIKGTDDSSDGEQDWKTQDRSSCDTLNQSAALDNSLASRRSGKVRRVSRQSQLKRHRMAQEIQRKLEETEVKTRELEHRGVHVEKQLRGEGNAESSGNNDSSQSTAEVCRDEAELLQEWFDLMRDRTELRRYEKELMVRAQELELEDRHSRLQAELRERLESTESKTEDDVRTEESIISEMMDIVAQRDSLISVLEEDRLRYSNEDKDLEEQMLAEGLRLTPIRKTPEK